LAVSKGALHLVGNGRRYRLKLGMKNLQETFVVVKETVDIVVDAFNRHVKQLLQVVSSQPKKPPLSWESILGEDAFKKTKLLVVAETTSPVELTKLLELPEANQRLAQLPPELLNELLRRIQMNILDEIKSIRLYEKLFNCEIKIIRGHVNFYKCSNEKVIETIDYATLINRLIQLLTAHKELISI
jgi:hypothetical protein